MKGEKLPSHEEDFKLTKLVKKLEKSNSKGDTERARKISKRIAKHKKTKGIAKDESDAKNKVENQDSTMDVVDEKESKKLKRKKDLLELEKRQDAASEAAMKSIKKLKEDDEKGHGNAKKNGNISESESAEAIENDENYSAEIEAKNTEKVTLVLFYQYVEPPWSSHEHEKALEFTASAAERCGMMGRLRVAREGLNGTMTGSAKKAREFCEELRNWQPENFKDTDFKFTDGLPSGQAFREINVWPVPELVGYGLTKHNTPLLSYGGKHLDAKEYHEMMKNPNTVVIDIRNAYESAIGHFCPPKGGAELIDPRMRKSTDFPGWLTSEETKKKIEGKTVMMYCTGGVRCERASALLGQLNLDVKDVYQLKGGIHRYLEEFRDGGFWSGKNYVFDKRFSHGAVEPIQKDPENSNSTNQNEAKVEVLGKCAACSCPWDMYRGKCKCFTCGVPLLVCHNCRSDKSKNKKKLRCPICVEDGITTKLPKERSKVKMEFGDERSTKKFGASDGRSSTSKTSHVENESLGKSPDNPGKITRLFVGNLSFKITEEVMKNAMPGITHIKWVTDKESGQFYGTSFVEMINANAAGRAVAMDGQKLLGRPLKINYAPCRPGDIWPPESGPSSPPIGSKNTDEKNSKQLTVTAVRERPNSYCKTLFIANVAFEAEDNDVIEFFNTSGELTIEKMRWLTHRDTGEFKGCGYIEFGTTEQADLAIQMHGKKLKGRPVKIDWDDSK